LRGKKVEVETRDCGASVWDYEEGFNQGYLLLRGLRKVKGEVGFTMLAYNMRRAINILGVGMLIALVKA